MDCATSTPPANPALLRSPVQMELIGMDPETLRLDIERHTGEPLQLVITDNATSIITYRPGRRGLPGCLRLHRMFLSAAPDVVHALGQWITQRKAVRAGAVIDAFIRGHRHLIRTGSSRRQTLRTAGRQHDLAAMYNEINASEFGGAVEAAITWGRGVHTRRQRRSIRFGSYSSRENLIRIHPALDRDCVPAYFVWYVVYHEMLHAAMGIDGEEGGRRRLHPPAFRERERDCPWYEKAMAWQSDPANLRKVLR
jgi:hypothetical protein